MKKLRKIFNNIGVKTIVEFITLALSLLSTFTGIITGNYLFFYITCALVFLSFIVLLYFLYSSNNREHTLHMLVKDNRTRTLLLLLTYNFLRNSPPEVNKGFSPSKLQAKRASYTYDFTPNEVSNGYYDLRCKFVFELTKNQRRKDFDILIMQPRGEKESAIEYSFNENAFVKAEVRPIELGEQKKASFTGLLWGRLKLPDEIEHLQKLTVRFRMKKVSRLQKEGAIIICPFIYVNMLTEFTIKMNYTEVPENYHPNAVSLQMIPYDGSHGIANEIADIQQISLGTWEATISGRKCRAHAIYIVSSYPKKS